MSNGVRLCGQTGDDRFTCKNVKMMDKISLHRLKIIVFEEKKYELTIKKGSDFTPYLNL